MKKVKLNLLIIIILFFSTNFIKAQLINEQSNWIVGCGPQLLDFNTGTSTDIGNTSFNSFEAYANISDASGNLLFYTDGDDIFDNSNNPMHNSSPILSGSANSFEGLSIVPRPSSTNEYYLFSSPTGASTVNQGLRFHHIDMNGNGGLGTVVAQDQPVSPDIDNDIESIAAIPHGNGIDYWVVTHVNDGIHQDELVAYLVNSGGVNNAVFSTTDILSNGFSPMAIEVSRNGTRFAISTFNYSLQEGIIHIYGFNRHSGIFIKIGQYKYNTTVNSIISNLCFSPSGNFIYTTYSDNNTSNIEIQQIDIAIAGYPYTPNTNLPSISHAIATTPTSVFYFQLGPDDKIYCSQNGIHELSVINTPDNLITNNTNEIGYGPAAFVFGSGSCLMVGLPNMIDAIPGISAPVDFVFNYSGCQETTFTSLIGQTGDSITWDFGDSTSATGTIGSVISGTGTTGNAENPVHSYSGPGPYTITMTINSIPAVHTFSFLPSSVSIAANSSACEGQTTSYTANPAGNYMYTWNVNNGSIISQTNNTVDVKLNTGPAILSLTVTDVALGCTGSASITESPNLLPAINFVAASNETCNGTSNGVASLYMTSNDPININWYNTNDLITSLGTGISITNLTQGSYVVEVADQSTGCISTKEFVISSGVHSSPAIPNYSPSVVCSDWDVQLIANGSGGTLTWYDDAGAVAGTGSPLNIGQLSYGHYTYCVTETKNGCESFCTPYSFEVLEPLQFTLSITDACDCDGSITANYFKGGAGGPFDYYWSGVSAINSSFADGLCANDYGLYITDQNLCTALFNNITVANLNGLAVNFSTPDIIQPTCPNFFDGELFSVASGGVGGYIYTWSKYNTISNTWTTSFTGTGQGTEVISNIGIGLYKIEITDGNGCKVSIQYDLSADPNCCDNFGVTFTTSNVTSCNGDDGTINLTTSGGNDPPYTYDWNNNNYDGQQNITGLAAGTYDVTITNGDGCITSGSVTLSEPACCNSTTLAVSFNTTENTYCNGSSATAQAVASGGSGSYNYTWLHDGSTSSTATNLIAGDYTVIVTDGICSVQSLVSISDPICCDGYDPIYFDSLNDVAPATSCSASNGSIYALWEGAEFDLYLYDESGQLMPNYPETGLDEDADMANLAPGVYEIILISTDDGCAAQLIADVGPQNCCGSFTSSVTSTPLTFCGGSDGTATVIASGGTPPYTYAWSHNQSLSPTTSYADDLPIGTHQVTTTDANQCTSTSWLIIGDAACCSAPSASVAVVHATECNQIGKAIVSATGGFAPYTYTWSHIGTPGSVFNYQNLAVGNYEVTVTDINGCSFLVEFAISIPCCSSDASGIYYTVTTSDVTTCGANDGEATVYATWTNNAPYTYYWPHNGSNSQHLTGMAPGTYEVIVGFQNIVSCTWAQTVVINEPICCSQYLDDSPVVNDATDCISADGNIALTLTGTAPYNCVTTSSNGYTNIHTAVNSIVENGLIPGEYYFTITDANGCQIEYTETVGPTSCCSSFTVSITANDVNSCGGFDGEAMVHPTGGTLPYSYSWSHNSSLSNSVQTVNDLPIGSHSVTVTDANNCSYIVNYSIGEPGCCTSMTMGWTSSTIIDADCCGGDGSAAFIFPFGAQGYYWLAGNENPSVEGWLDGNVSWSIGNAPIWSNDLSATDLPIGHYFMEVTTQEGYCTQTLEFDIGISPDVQVTVSVTDVECDEYGSANLISNCNVNWDYWLVGNETPAIVGDIDDENEIELEDLPPGHYFVSVTSSSGCNDLIEFDINVPNDCCDDANELIDSLTTPSDCGSDNGEIYVEYDVEFNYQISTDINFTPDSIVDGNDNYQDTELEVLDLVPGTYYVKIITVVDIVHCEEILTFTINEINCCGSHIPVVILAAPGTEACEGDIITITTATNYNSYQWSVYNGMTNVFDPITGATNQTLDITIAGTYFVSVSDANGCTSNAQIEITIHPIPEPEITAPDGVIICGGSAITLDAGSGFISYSWTRNNDPTVIGTSQTIIRTKGGKYYVTVEDSNGCTGTDWIRVRKVKKNTPVISVVGQGVLASVMICSGDLIELETTELFSTYNWIQDGDYSNPIWIGKSPAIDEAGIYTVVVTDQWGCQWESNSIEVFISKPKATITGTKKICAGQDITLIATGGFDEYTWTLPNAGGTETEVIGELNISPATVAHNGTYLLTVTDANACTGESFYTVSVSPPFNVSISGATALCPGDKIKLDAGSSYIAYQWEKNGVELSGEVDQSLIISEVGTYSVSVTDRNGCTGIGTITVEFGCPPDWVFGSYVGLSFKTDPPTVVDDIWQNNTLNRINSPIVNIHHPITGDLLMYSDGIDLWNANHQLVNGPPVNSSYLPLSSEHNSQSIAVPYPGHPHEYYVLSPPSFTTHFDRLDFAHISTSGLGSVSGFGSFTDSGIGKLSNVLTVIPHCNGVDYWIITHGYHNNSKFKVWELTNQGLTSISQPATTQSSGVKVQLGWLEASKDGSKIALISTTDQHGVYLFDFDNSTGIISNKLVVEESLNPYAYGYAYASFSNNGDYLYYNKGTGTQGTGPNGELIQYYLPDSSAISLYQTYNNNTDKFLAMQIGPDGKLYITNQEKTHLSVIEDPDIFNPSITFNSIDMSAIDPIVKSYSSLPHLIDAESIPCSPTLRLENADGNNLSNSKFEILANEWMIIAYPNPNNGSFNIELPGDTETQFRVEVFNILGEIVYRNTLAGKSKYEIALTEKTTGIYTIKIQSNNKYGIEKLIVK